MVLTLTLESRTPGTGSPLALMVPCMEVIATAAGVLTAVLWVAGSRTFTKITGATPKSLKLAYMD